MFWPENLKKITVIICTNNSVKFKIVEFKNLIVMDKQNFQIASKARNSSFIKFLENLKIINLEIFNYFIRFQII